MTLMQPIASLGGGMISTMPKRGPGARMPSYGGDYNSWLKQFRRWLLTMPLDGQTQILSELDPTQDRNPDSPLRSKDFNREIKRIERIESRWRAEVFALKRPCLCQNCRNHRAKRYPAYYVPRGISFECWMEGRALTIESIRESDPDLADELIRLENVGGGYWHHDWDERRAEMWRQDWERADTSGVEVDSTASNLCGEPIRNPGGIIVQRHFSVGASRKNGNGNGSHSG